MNGFIEMFYREGLGIPGRTIIAVTYFFFR